MVTGAYPVSFRKLEPVLVTAARWDLVAPSNPVLPKWVLRAFEWAANKLGLRNQRWEQVVANYREWTCDHDTIVRRCLAQIDHLRRDGRRPRYLFVGPDAADELREWAYCSYPSYVRMTFDPPVIHRWRPEWDCIIYDLRVILVPWMKGELVLPDMPDEFNPLIRRRL